jgi:hypothetical protein
MTSAERGRAFRARQEANAALDSNLAAARERIHTLEADLAAARSEARALRSQLASQQDLEATAARHQAVASSALFLLSVIMNDGCRAMGTPGTGNPGGAVGA